MARLPALHPSEHQIQAALVEVLRVSAYPGVFWWAVPNGGKRAIGTAVRLKAEGVRAGVPDLVFIINGLTHGLEMKKRGGSQSLAQKAAQIAWEAAGGVYAVARGVDEALDVLASWDALKRKQEVT